ncbi:MAG: glycerophosphodiester phosphodiesterase, partial [Actinobacteria bacterium]|nr:glycerophosphodiester phosphodiesterase [Actinomycetota bacterium]
IKNSPGDLADGPGGPAVADEVVAVVAALEAERRAEILVSSFDLPTIGRVKQVDPALLTGYLVFDLSEQPDALRIAVDGGHDALHPWDGFVTEAMADECHRSGLLLNTWTVDDPNRWEELRRWAVDGIVTNTPGRLVTAMAHRG